MVHIYNGILLSYKKGEILPFATTWMNLEGIMFSEYVKDKYSMLSIICRILKKANSQNRVEW